MRWENFQKLLSNKLKSFVEKILLAYLCKHVFGEISTLITLHWEEYLCEADLAVRSWSRFYYDSIPKSARLYIWNRLTACSNRESVHHQKQIAMIACASGEAVQAFLNFYFFATRPISFWDGKKRFAVVWSSVVHRLRERDDVSVGVDTHFVVVVIFAVSGMRCTQCVLLQRLHNDFIRSFGYGLMQVMVAVCARWQTKRLRESIAINQNQIKIATN